MSTMISSGSQGGRGHSLYKDYIDPARKGGLNFDKKWGLQTYLIKKRVLPKECLRILNWVLKWSSETNGFLRQT